MKETTLQTAEMIMSNNNYIDYYEEAFKVIAYALMDFVIVDLYSPHEQKDMFDPGIISLAEDMRARAYPPDKFLVGYAEMMLKNSKVAQCLYNHYDEMIALSEAILDTMTIFVPDAPRKSLPTIDIWIPDDVFGVLSNSDLSDEERQKKIEEFKKDGKIASNIRRKNSSRTDNPVLRKFLEKHFKRAKNGMLSWSTPYGELIIKRRKRKYKMIFSFRSLDLVDVEITDTGKVLTTKITTRPEDIVRHMRDEKYGNNPIHSFGIAVSDIHKRFFGLSYDLPKGTLLENFYELYATIIATNCMLNNADITDDYLFTTVVVNDPEKPYKRDFMVTSAVSTTMTCIAIAACEMVNKYIAELTGGNES